jgi:hypothetical protein
VQGDGEGTGQVVEPGGPRREEDRIGAPGPDRLIDALLGAADVGKAVDVLRKLARGSVFLTWLVRRSYLQRM